MTACGLVLLAAALFFVVPWVYDGGSNVGAAIQFLMTTLVALVVWGIAGVLTIISLVLAWRRRCGWFWPRCAVACCLVLPIGFYATLHWPTQDRMVIAAGEGREAYVASALRLGCDIDAPLEYGLGFNPVSAPPRKGRTALTMAVLRRQEAMVRFLLGRGADANRRDGEQETPLELAERMQQDAIVELLVRHGAVRRPNPDQR